MAHLKKYYQKYLEDFEIDSSLVGPLVAKGKQHRVHLYGKDQVIKIPRASIYMRSYGQFTADQVERDIAFIAEHFPDLVLPTLVLRGNKVPEHYLLLQEYLPHAVPVTMYADSVVRGQLRILMQRNMELLRKKHFFLDIFGYKGFTESLRALWPMSSALAQLTNVLVKRTHEESPRLVLVDTNLSHLNQKGEFRLTHRAIYLFTILLSIGLYWIHFRKIER